jgi:acetyl-CoA C-acetyltransferase
MVIPTIHAAKEQNASMIEIADIMAEKWNITREECDAFAFRSQMRADAATKAGYFTEEIVPIEIPATKIQRVLI